MEGQSFNVEATIGKPESEFIKVHEFKLIELT